MERALRSTDPHVKLVAMLRAGEISKNAIELAAYCGYAPATHIYETPKHLFPYEWFEHLHEFGGRRACILAALEIGKDISGVHELGMNYLVNNNRADADRFIVAHEHRQLWGDDLIRYGLAYIITDATYTTGQWTGLGVQVRALYEQKPCNPRNIFDRLLRDSLGDLWI